ncbi:vitamin D-binding protein [Hemicordylus capensis]|uniref:vitamin D-binding protein n=1 Tax=Hemicordylus capensis TaxID=884348 RepID=UPI0023046A67|nr:vitamin D-binding protein [Hemicordylus capensis]
MKTAVVTVLLLMLTFTHALERGRDYMFQKICEDFNTVGKENFRSGAIILHSKKYSNATFEEIISIVNQIVGTAEKCCSNGPNFECYETESLALSTKACDQNSPFPKLQGTAACCAQQGLERKLCLAALKHPPKEFPTYVEPSNEELCEAFKTDPQDFADRFLYEYSTDFSQAPFPVLLSSAESFLSSAKTCCVSPAPTVCFLKEKLKRQPIQKVTFLTNKACSRYALFGKEKTKLSYLITYTQRSPNASFEDVLSLAEQWAEILAKCCDPVNDTQCIQREVAAHSLEICKKLAAKDTRIKECCQDNYRLNRHHCIYSVPWAKPFQFPDFERPSDEVLCGEGKEQEFLRALYNHAQRYTRVPEVLLTVVHKDATDMVNSCCGAADSSACFAAKRPELSNIRTELLREGNKLCDAYTDLTFLEFKKRLTENFDKILPDAPADVISGLVEQRANFASTCCFLNAPPSYCGLKAETGFGHTCAHGQCVQH